MRARRARSAAVALPLAALVAGCAPHPAPSLRIGALFPLSGPQASLSREELRGVEMAADLANADGGTGGRRIVLDTRPLDAASAAGGAVSSLRDDGVPLIIGTYSSALSVPASQAAAGLGLTYWEAGAVADRVTGRGLPRVFRVGATGSNLGSNSARFAAEELSPRLGIPPSRLRVSIVSEDDEYGRSIAGAAARTAQALGMPVVEHTRYDAFSPDWPRVLGDVRAARPDVLVLASYIPDGVDFRRAMLASGLRVGALIGSTMAECGPEFGALLGADAVGVFASDRPTSGFNPSVLRPGGRTAYDRFAARWRAAAHGEPTEEGLAGFTAGWALFHHVLPRASSLDSEGIAAAARSTELGAGDLPNGGGLRFSRDPGLLGQNLDAAAVIWQWQAVRRSVTVWPAAYATGAPALVPLPR